MLLKKSSAQPHSVELFVRPLVPLARRLATGAATSTMALQGEVVREAALALLIRKLGALQRGTSRRELLKTGR